MPRIPRHTKVLCRSLSSPAEPHVITYNETRRAHSVALWREVSTTESVVWAVDLAADNRAALGLAVDRWIEEAPADRREIVRAHVHGIKTLLNDPNQMCTEDGLTRLCHRARVAHDLACEADTDIAAAKGGALDYVFATTVGAS